MKKKKIEPISMVLFNKTDKELNTKYKKERAKFIAGWEIYKPGHRVGLFGWKGGRDVKDPVVGEAEWNKMYPEGFNSWAGHQGNVLNSIGQQRLIDKLNEVIEYINKKK